MLQPRNKKSIMRTAADVVATAPCEVYGELVATATQ